MSDGLGYFCNTGSRSDINVTIHVHTPSGDVWRNNLPPILVIMAKTDLAPHTECIQEYGYPSGSYGLCISFVNIALFLPLSGPLVTNAVAWVASTTASPDLRRPRLQKDEAVETSCPLSSVVRELASESIHCCFVAECKQQ